MSQLLRPNGDQVPITEESNEHRTELSSNSQHNLDPAENVTTDAFML